MPPPDLSKIRAILLDIEGTTTPIDFIFKTLFPFAADNAEEFLRRSYAEKEVAAILEELRKQHATEAGKDAGAGIWVDTSPEEIASSAASYVRRLIARDSKITPLKALQGKIWEEGYRRGELRGELYPDVPKAFQRWHARGIRIAIFSSGSILAQKLLFQHSNAGDLSEFIESYFDTTTGPKREAESYRKIAGELGLAPEEILFLSDVIGELEAARAAGMATAQALRPGVIAGGTSVHPVISTFDGLFA
jgi:enolase-phosphatase E1